jgi:TrmH RNA methyltransferase
MRERIYGVQACLAAFRARGKGVRRAWVTEKAAPQVGEMLRALAKRRRPYHVVSEDELGRVSGAVHHEGICIEADQAVAPDLEQVLGSLEARPDTPARLLYLDGISNPHNLGALLRTAAHFGVHAVVGSEGELPAVRGAARRVAEGAAEHVPVVPVPDAAGALDRVQRAGVVPVATVADEGHDLYEAELPARCILLLGAERTGLSAKLQRRAELAVRIPGTGSVQSLNVSAACAVLLAEHYRRFRGDGR